MTGRLTQGSFNSEFACVKTLVVLRRESDNSANTVLYNIVRIGIRSNSLKKSRALLYSDLVRQTNSHASSEPSCVKRAVMRQANRHASTVMRQPSEYDINSTVSLFLRFGPSCVSRHASKYELAFRSHHGGSSVSRARACRTSSRWPLG